MKIVACYKCVPNSESISVARDRTLDFSAVQWEIGQYDLRAIEAAMQMAADGADSVAVLTVGGAITENSKMKKAVLSRGPQEMFGIKDTAFEAADSISIAKALSAGIAKIGDVDLVICGEGSSDMYSQQTGIILGGILGWTTLNAVASISKTDNGLRVTRVVDDGVETLDIALPAVISVTSDINMPRIPTMKDILGAGKKPSTIWTAADVDAEISVKAETLSILAPEETDRKRIVLNSGEEGAVEQFVSYLKSAL